MFVRRRRSNRPGNSQAKGPQGRHISGEQWRKSHSPKGVSWLPHMASEISQVTDRGGVRAAIIAACEASL